MKLETKIGVFVPLDDFNRMAKADLLTKMQDHVVVVLVHNELRIPMGVPTTTTVGQLAKCLMALANIQYSISTDMRTADEERWDATDTLKLRRVTDGTPLFCVPVISESQATSVAAEIGRRMAT